MRTGADMIALSESFRDMAGGSQVLDAFQDRFRSFGATHFLVTGVPLPGRPIEPLILRMNWGDVRAGAVKGDDPLLGLAFSARRLFTWCGGADKVVDGESALLSELGPLEHVHLLGAPICAFLPYQAVVMAGGPTLRIPLDAKSLIDHVTAEAFRRLFALGFVRPERPGELSARERSVVELSAGGRTANEIATILEISQRTVHAHLQNASEKLRAHNKTHTVVEALRYGQITV